MPAKKQQNLSPADDPMIWFHLAKLMNLSYRADTETEQQMRQSIKRIVAILKGEHQQEEEPEAFTILQRVAEIVTEKD